MAGLMTLALIERNPGTLGRKMTERTNRFLADEQRARQDAARVATAATQRGVRNVRPSNVPARRGRLASGQLRNALEWDATSSGDVAFDVSKADAKAPFWIIQEIGTGERAVMRRGGQSLPTGRPKAGASYVRTVKSQRGRVIPASLAFATGPRGSYSPAGSARGQQLYLRSQIKGAPARVRRGAGKNSLVITREIQGQHFVRDGGREGFRQYKPNALAAARRAFAGQRFRP